MLCIRGHEGTHCGCSGSIKRERRLWLDIILSDSFRWRPGLGKRMGRVRVADRVDLLFPPRNRVKPVFARGYRPLLYSSGSLRAGVRKSREIREGAMPYYLCETEWNYPTIEWSARWQDFVALTRYFAVIPLPSKFTSRWMLIQHLLEFLSITIFLRI